MYGKATLAIAHEIGFLNRFMNLIIDQPNGLTFRNANRQFFDNTGGCSDNRLQPIFGSLPSFVNSDFRPFLKSKIIEASSSSSSFAGRSRVVISRQILTLRLDFRANFRPYTGRILTPGAKVRQFDTFKDAVEKNTHKRRLTQILVEADWLSARQHSSYDAKD